MNDPRPPVSRSVVPARTSPPAPDAALDRALALAAVKYARPALTADAAGPLASADYAAVRQALAARRPVQRAARIARASAISTLLIGAISLPIVVLSPSWMGAVATVALFTVGAIEYRGADLLSKAQLRAASLLARNQLLLLGLVVLYCVGQIVRAQQAPPGGMLSAETRAQVADLIPNLDQMVRDWVIFGYGLVILLSLACQGGLAWYYFTRRRYLRDIQNATPPWIQRLFMELNL